MLLPNTSSNHVLIGANIEGQQLRYCGVGVGYDDIYIQGNPAEMKFIAYYIKGGQITAVAR
jgi:apoptosis-inducing factor 3